MKKFPSIDLIMSHVTLVSIFFLPLYIPVPVEFPRWVWPLMLVSCGWACGASLYLWLYDRRR